MLKTILSISGKPGLFKLISQAKNMLIVESLQTGKRQPAYAHEKIISLGDIAIFTDEEDVPLSEVLNAIKEKENGAKVTLDIKKADNETLRARHEQDVHEYPLTVEQGRLASGYLPLVPVTGKSCYRAYVRI